MRKYLTTITVIIFMVIGILTTTGFDLSGETASVNPTQLPLIVISPTTVLSANPQETISYNNIISLFEGTINDVEYDTNRFYNPKTFTHLINKNNYHIITLEYDKNGSINGFKAQMDVWIKDYWDNGENSFYALRRKGNEDNYGWEFSYGYLVVKDNIAILLDINMPQEEAQRYEQMINNL